MKTLVQIYFRDWRHFSLSFGASFFPVITALFLTGFVSVDHAVPYTGEVVPMVPVETVTASDLESLFDDIGYVWPPQSEVPPLAISQFPPDIDRLDIKKKKSLFFRALLPLVVAENAQLRHDRRWLEGVMRNGNFGSVVEQARLQRLLEEHGLHVTAGIDAALLERLYQRVDVIPVGLALAQAANETGWGTSRFSREANNLFGEWTYRVEEGILPLRRRQGAEHYVRRFANLRESVRSYLNNLNRHRAYKRLRQLRANQRKEGLEPDALTLAGGLLSYSERGVAYVADIRSLIRGNGLNDLGPLRLARYATVD